MPRKPSTEAALVTGAASGIGRACAQALLARGAAVAGLDKNPDVIKTFRRREFLGLRGDITSEEDILAALAAVKKRWGRLDILVLNAGIFPPSRRIDSLDLAYWRAVMSVNLDSSVALLREAHPWLKQSPRGGRVVVIGSKNVAAPGPGAAAYSASKAALTQLARVAALEWAADGVRVNIIHPDAVFDTGLWTKEALALRARQYGLSVAEYKTRNLLKCEILSRDVGEMAAEMCGPLFAKTTGAQVSLDGGNERVI